MPGPIGTIASRIKAEVKAEWHHIYDSFRKLESDTISFTNSKGELRAMSVTTSFVDANEALKEFAEETVLVRSGLADFEYFGKKDKHPCWIL